MKTLFIKIKHNDYNYVYRNFKKQKNYNHNYNFDNLLLFIQKTRNSLPPLRVISYYCTTSITIPNIFL